MHDKAEFEEALLELLSTGGQHYGEAQGEQGQDEHERHERLHRYEERWGMNEE